MTQKKKPYDSVAEGAMLVERLRESLQWDEIHDETGISVTGLQQIKKRQNKTVLSETIRTLRDAVSRLENGMIGRNSQPQEVLMVSKYNRYAQGRGLPSWDELPEVDRETLRKRWRMITPEIEVVANELEMKALVYFEQNMTRARSDI